MVNKITVKSVVVWKAEEASAKWKPKKALEYFRILTIESDQRAPSCLKLQFDESEKADCPALLNHQRCGKLADPQARGALKPGHVV
jgi:two-component SAPR family response regulator